MNADPRIAWTDSGKLLLSLTKELKELKQHQQEQDRKHEEEIKSLNANLEKLRIKVDSSSSKNYFFPKVPINSCVGDPCMELGTSAQMKLKLMDNQYFR